MFALLIHSFKFFRSEFYEFCMDERLGTHLNAPSMYLHRNESLNADKIPLEMLVAVKGSFEANEAESNRLVRYVQLIKAFAPVFPSFSRHRGLKARNAGWRPQFRHLDFERPQ